MNRILMGVGAISLIFLLSSESNAQSCYRGYGGPAVRSYSSYSSYSYGTPYGYRSTTFYNPGVRNYNVAPGYHRHPRHPYHHGNLYGSQYRGPSNFHHGGRQGVYYNGGNLSFRIGF